MSTGIIPAEPVIELSVGAPVLRISSAMAHRWCDRGVDRLEEWKASAGGAQKALYIAVKGAANIGMPMIGSFVGALADTGFLPPLPPRPRHSDPIVYLARYVADVLPYLAARAPWELVADPATGEVHDLLWGGVSMTADLGHTPAVVVESLPEEASK
jgi:hypothetical protein